jgi:hypothetical protein
MSDFKPSVLGITAFMASNRVDFVLEGPEQPPVRASLFYNRPEETVKLNNKVLRITGFDNNEEGEPTRLNVRWGRQNITLGRRWNATGNVSFYRSIEATNTVAGPRSAAEITEALSLFASAS